MQTSVDVYLSEFPDYEVLEAAIALVKAAPKHRSGEADRLVAELRDHFLAEVAEDDLPPISTAAKIQSLEDLRAWRAKQAPAPSEPVPA